MRIALIADTFPPLRTSGAVQLRDLSREFVRQGHALTVMLPSANLDGPYQIEHTEGARILRLKAPQTKGVDLFTRTINEFLMPFWMGHHLRCSPIVSENWDGIVWYSPSIFHGPLVRSLKDSSACKSYLIIRDIFPDWAVDLGLMSRGLPYRCFDAVARYQYSIADVIGVQAPGNLSYFERWKKKKEKKLEVLQNWLDAPANVRCSIRVSETDIEDRKVFVYAGNMGSPQGIGILLDLAERFTTRPDVGFLFVGRGSEAAQLKKWAQDRQLHHVLFFDEIHPDEIPDLYAQCDIGLVALDPRHKSHNIPGKFLSYMQSGLPVLANVNPGNDLAAMIRAERVGQVCESNQLDELVELAHQLLEQIELDKQVSARCIDLFRREFSVQKAVQQIVSALAS